ncbi:Uncharacterized protein APZ42_008652, partial [Daphnia magna]
VLTVFGKFPIGFGLFLVTCDHRVEKHELHRCSEDTVRKKHPAQSTVETVLILSGTMVRPLSAAFQCPI